MFGVYFLPEGVAKMAPVSFLCENAIHVPDLHPLNIEDVNGDSFLNL